jgi:hypothetical protein
MEHQTTTHRIRCSRPAMWRVALVAAWLATSPVHAFVDSDADGDGVPDEFDNCLLVANPIQADVDGDGFGNVCDGDFNNDNLTNVEDLQQLKSAFLRSGFEVAAEDLDGNGTVNLVDLQLFRKLFLKPPGPAGEPQPESASGVRCTPILVGNGVLRCVEVKDDRSVNLYLSPYDSRPWNGTYWQSDEPDDNYCGPTAGMNFLLWYGLDDSYETLARDMKTNTWDRLAALGTAAAICGGEPICTTVLAVTASEAIVKAGSLPHDVRETLYNRMPDGYEACGREGIGSLDDVQASLAAGNPVVYLESGGTNNLHWAVITGIDYSGAEPLVHVANAGWRTWSSFNPAWGLSNIGNDFVYRVMVDDLLGLDLTPFTEVRWCKTPTPPPPPGSIPSGYLTRQVVVPAGSEAPVATGVRTQPNDPLVITATGLWSNVGPPALGPGGWIGYKHPGTREEADLASLVGYFRVPGAGYASWIPIGAHFAGTSPTPITGTLALVMNDVWGTYADNQGSVTAFASFRGCAEVRVPANQPWTDTGIVAPPGTPFLVKATGGRWSNVGPPALDANGFVGYRHPGTVLESANLASLIGRIGNDVFPLGSYEDHGFATQDTLFLGMNDVPSTYGDNQGAIDVDVCYGWIIY